MALTKNQKIAAGAGCIGCLGLVFIILVVTGGLAFFALNSGDETTPHAQQPQRAQGGDQPQPGAPQPGEQAPPEAQQPGDQPQPASGSNAAVESIRNQLARANEIDRGQGYVPAGEPSAAALNNRTQTDIGVNLTAGGQYLMVGVCDNDCSDVDLQLFSADGQKIAEDVATDDNPVLQFTATASGQHRARVVMANCSSEPCAFGVALYAKQ